MTLPSLIVGAFGWTLVEYLLHRFDGHGMRGRTPFSREHLRHHADPAWYAPWWKKALAAVILVVPAAAALGPTVGWATAIPLLTGFVGAWLAYEWLHRRIHTHAPLGAWGRWARRHHLLHHHRSPRSNHGVTSPLWDLVFGTWDRTPVVVLPKRQAPRWLLDPATGDVLPEHATTFRVAQRRAS